MSKTPVRGGEEVVTALLRKGFAVVRQKGSHVILVKDRTTVVVPVHAGHDLPIGTLKQIMRVTGLQAEDL